MVKLERSSVVGVRTAVDVPFTVAADCDLGAGAAPWLAA